MKEMYRQGDLLFIKVDNLPNGLLLKNDKHILNSSVTGHNHSILKGKVYINENPTWNEQGNFYLELLEDDELVHQEHKTIELPEGIYEVRRQREVNGYVRD